MQHRSVTTPPYPARRLLALAALSLGACSADPVSLPAVAALRVTVPGLLPPPGGLGFGGVGLTVVVIAQALAADSAVLDSAVAARWASRDTAVVVVRYTTIGLGGQSQPAALVTSRRPGATVVEATADIEGRTLRAEFSVFVSSLGLPALGSRTSLGESPPDVTLQTGPVTHPGSLPAASGGASSIAPARSEPRG
jgi:hypothetical protein